MLAPQVPGFLQALISTFVFFLFYYFYAANSFYRDPGSIFYDPARAFERSYSLHREIESVSFRNEALFAQSTGRVDSETIWKAGNTPTICAVVVTVARNNGHKAHPLELTITSLLAGLSQAEREDLDLRVYFANTEPSQHPLWHNWLLDLVDKSIAVDNITSPSQFQELQQLEKERSYFHKTGLDFAYALEDCYLSSSAPYIAIFEGDILVADGWFARARMGLKNIARHSEPWLDMRLFNEERSIGWDSNALLGNNVLWISMGISAALLSVTFLLRRRTKFNSFSNPTLAVVCLIFIPSFVILFFQSGKASMLPPKAGVVVQNWGCCTQGLVLPREEVPGFVSELRNQAFITSPDIIAIDYAEARKLRRYALNPVQVQHLGFNSLLTPNRPRDQSVWSVAFEDLDPRKLKKDHKAMVEQLYGDAAKRRFEDDTA